MIVVKLPFTSIYSNFHLPVRYGYPCLLTFHGFTFFCALPNYGVITYVYSHPKGVNMCGCGPISCLTATRITVLSSDRITM